MPAATRGFFAPRHHVTMGRGVKTPDAGMLHRTIPYLRSVWSLFCTDDGAATPTLAINAGQNAQPANRPPCMIAKTAACVQ